MPKQRSRTLIPKEGSRDPSIDDNIDPGLRSNASNQSRRQQPNYGYGGGGPLDYHSQSYDFPDQAPYGSGGQAPYGSGGQAPYGYGSQAPYAHGGQASYPSFGQAPPPPSVVAYADPFSAGGTSQEAPISYNRDDRPHTMIYCDGFGGCGEPIVKLYHDAVQPGNVSRRRNTDSRGREYTTFHDNQSGNEVARVWSDGGNGSCSWHMGGTASQISGDKYPKKRVHHRKPRS